MEIMINICKWLALSYVDNFDAEYDTFTVCGYDLTSCTCMIASYNENGVPIMHIFSFNDFFDDESIECGETVIFEEVPFPLVRSFENAYKLFSLMIEGFEAVKIFGVSNLGFNTFHINDDKSLKLVES